VATTKKRNEDSWCGVYEIWLVNHLNFCIKNLKCYEVLCLALSSRRFMDKILLQAERVRFFSSSMGFNSTSKLHSPMSNLHSLFIIQLVGVWDHIQPNNNAQGINPYPGSSTNPLASLWPHSAFGDSALLVAGTDANGAGNLFGFDVVKWVWTPFTNKLPSFQVCALL